jgi:hypothetical protein
MCDDYDKTPPEFDQEPLADTNHTKLVRVKNQNQNSHLHVALWII